MGLAHHLTAALATAVVAVAAATDCPVAPVCDVLDRVTFAAIGTVTGVTTFADGTCMILFRVDQSLKGGLLERDIYTFAAESSATCQSKSTVGALYALTFTANDEGMLFGSNCDINKPFTSLPLDDASIFTRYPDSCNTANRPCPDGVKRATCFMDPCKAVACSAYPSANCVADYCGGCNARFFYNGTEVTKVCEGSGKCPDGSKAFSCFVDPCRTSKCPAFPSATCVADYCGGCNARFYSRGVEVTKQCQPSRATLSSSCPNGKEPADCPIDPCTMTFCRAYPDAACVPDACEGCLVKFYNNGLDVTEECNGCPPDKPLATCFTDPCLYHSCSIYPNATCKADNCGGCNAAFYVDGVKVDC